MDHLTNLFKLMELTRSQPQYGYAVGGVNTRIGNLAEHHYLVTMFGWQLADLVNKKGAKIDFYKINKFFLLFLPILEPLILYLSFLVDR